MLFILLIPLVIFPIIILVPPILANPTLTPSPVLVVNMDNGAQGTNLTKQISQTQGLVVTTGDANTNVQAQVLSGRFDAGLLIPENFTELIAENQTAPIQLYYDATYSRSTIAVGLLEAALLSYSQQIVILRNSGNPALIPIGITPTALSGVRPLVTTVGLLLPILWVGWASIAGVYLALDVTATEEGDSVVTSLLASPYTRFELLMGKALFLFAVTLFVATLTVLGLYVIPTLGVFIGSHFSDLIVQGSIPLTPGSIGTIALGVGLTFAVSAFLIQFLSIFLTGAGRLKIILTGLLGIAATSGFVLSTNKMNLGSGVDFLPLISTYGLLSRVVLGGASIADVAFVALGGVGFSFLFLLLAYRTYSGEGLLLHTAFARDEPVDEEEAVPKQPETPSSRDEYREPR
jgi:ABC-type Na+ efflux pump permease subunit